MTAAGDEGIGMQLRFVLEGCARGIGMGAGRVERMAWQLSRGASHVQRAANTVARRACKVERLAFGAARSRTDCGQT